MREKIYNVTVIPILAGRLRKETGGNWRSDQRIETIQLTALVMSALILRRITVNKKTCYHPYFIRALTVKTSMIKPQEEINYHTTKLVNNSHANHILCTWNNYKEPENENRVPQNSENKCDRRDPNN